MFFSSPIFFENGGGWVGALCGVSGQILIITHTCQV
jgi:hypothetical protein